jgi:hypothetical protein
MPIVGRREPCQVCPETIVENGVPGRAVKGLVVFLVFCALSVQAQVQINAWSMAPTPSTPFKTYVVQNIDGVTLQLIAQSADLTGTCSVVPCSTNITGFGTFDGTVSVWAALTCGATLRGVGTACNTNIAVNHITNPGVNSDTPPYVFSQNWADTACQAASNEWTANTTYAMGYCITPQTGFASHYYVMSGTPTTGVCNSGGTPPTSWPTGGGSISDGGGCVWQDTGAHAPPLDIAVGLAYPGSIPQWVSGKSYSAVNNAIIGCGVAYCSAHYYQEQLDSSCTSGMGAPTWSTSGFPTTDGSGASACHWQDIGTDNQGIPFNANTNPQTDTLTFIAQGFPAIWETPYAYWFKLFNAAMENHYASTSMFPTVKYIRVGVSLGGEASTIQTNVLESFTHGPTNDAQLKGVWTSFAAQSYLDNAATRAAMISPPSWYLLSSLNCGTGLTGTGPTIEGGSDCTWADAEAQATLAADAIYGQVYGYGTQGLKNGVDGSDLLTIQNGAACVGSTCCSNNWCEVRGYTIGRVPIIQLQECNKSTAGGGLSGCLDDQDSPYNPAITLEQVFALATQHGTNVMEIYGDDLQCAFVPGYVGAATNGCQTSPVPAYGYVYQRYAATIQNLAYGLPNGTVQAQGGAQIQGSTTTQ